MLPIFWAAIFACILLTSFFAANLLFWNGVPFHVSRKIAHMAAAIPIGLAPLVFESVWWPVGLTLLFLLLMAFSHWKNYFPGVVKAGRWSEIYFPVSVLIALLLWPLNPWAAAVPGVFLALGDGVAGITRSVIYKHRNKSVWGTVACLVACALIALLVVPYWIGLAGALAFTLAEYLSGGEVGRFRLDDNLVAPVSATAVMGLLLII